MSCQKIKRKKKKLLLFGGGGRTIPANRAFNINHHIDILHHLNKTFPSFTHRANIQRHSLPLRIKQPMSIQQQRNSRSALARQQL
jgi:hypothetical protein